MVSIPDHLRSGESGDVLGIAVGTIVGNVGCVVRHWHVQELNLERWEVPCGVAVGHDGGEVPAGRGAAHADFRGVEVEMAASCAVDPEEGFPGVVHGGGEGVFGSQARYQVVSKGESN